MEDKTIIVGDIDITSLIRASKTLDEALVRALKNEEDDMLRDACIQRFEYCFELGWKMMKRVLGYQGVEVNSPRQVFRQATKEGLVDGPEPWFEFLEKRNLTVHTYNDDTAAEIWQVLPVFQKKLHILIANLNIFSHFTFNNHL